MAGTRGSSFIVAFTTLSHSSRNKQLLLWAHGDARLISYKQLYKQQQAPGVHQWQCMPCYNSAVGTFRTCGPAVHLLRLRLIYTYILHETKPTSKRNAVIGLPLGVHNESS